jgi:hypothetical protein
MLEWLAPKKRVRVREAHNLRGEVVDFADDGNIAKVRFDYHYGVHPYHVEELEPEAGQPESSPCTCVFCRHKSGIPRP